MKVIVRIQRAFVCRKAIFPVYNSASSFYIKGGTWLMKKLMQQYIETRKELENSKVGATEKDISIINGMISDINYALEWMRTKQPGKKEELNVGRHMNVRNHVTHY